MVLASNSATCTLLSNLADCIRLFYSYAWALAIQHGSLALYLWHRCCCMFHKWLHVADAFAQKRIDIDRYWSNIFRYCLFFDTFCPAYWAQKVCKTFCRFFSGQWWKPGFWWMRRNNPPRIWSCQSHFGAGGSGADSKSGKNCIFSVACVYLVHVVPKGKNQSRPSTKNMHLSHSCYLSHRTASANFFAITRPCAVHGGCKSLAGSGADPPIVVCLFIAPLSGHNGNPVSRSGDMYVSHPFISLQKNPNRLPGLRTKFFYKHVALGA